MTTAKVLFHEESEGVKLGTGQRLIVAAEYTANFNGLLPRVGEYVYTGTDGGRVFDVQYLPEHITVHVWRQGPPS